MSQDVGKEIYNNIAEFGVFTAKVKLYLAIFFGVILAFFALKVLMIGDSHLVKTKGHVFKSECKNIPKKRTKVCSMDVRYKANDKDYSAKIVSQGGTEYKKGDTLNLTYNIKDTSKVVKDVPSSKKIAFMFGGSALFLVLFAFLNTYLAEKYKIYAATHGSLTIIDFLMMFFR